MIKTLKTSFALKNTYRVNTILYALRQIPLVKRLIPPSLYRVKGLKIFVYVLTGIWELITIFGGKILYFLTLVTGMGLLFDKTPGDVTFLHILLFLTLIGGFTNTSLFNPSKDKFYAVLLLRMDAQAYTRIHYWYDMGKVVIGFLPCTIFFGLSRQLPLWLCLLLPFGVAGWKLWIAAASLWDYERRGEVFNENKLGVKLWGIAGVLILAAYAPPAIGFVLPKWVSTAVFMLFLPAGAVGAVKIWRFSSYREIYQQLAAQAKHQMDAVATASKKQAEKAISADQSITSSRKGFEYLNELFIKRHKTILWSAAQKITLVCLGIIGLVLLLFQLEPITKEVVNELLMAYLPYFVFIMYLLNRGTSFTKVLFMNCDHSLLTYAFYKDPKMILQLFTIRLREIMKINLLPASVIGVGLALLLYCSGGTDNPLNYGVIVVSILAMSLFFSVHYLTIYYLLQPYNAATELKSGTYQIINFVTYFVCYSMIRLQLPTLLFGTVCILFCLLYCVVACILVYRFAPKTFHLRT